MKKRYDPTTRNLIEMGPAEWASYLGSPQDDPDKVIVIDSNLSTIAAEADKVLWIKAPKPWIQHVELQAGRDIRLEERSHLYSTLLGYQFQVPVRTNVVLLRPAADGPELTGLREQKDHNGDVYDSFRYNVIRVWEQPVDFVLSCGLTVLPLAPVSKVEIEKVPEVLLAISDRLARETTPEQAAILWNAIEILMGLRYEKAQIDKFFEGVWDMLFGIRGIEESTVYQGILQKGRMEGHMEGRMEGRVEGRVEGHMEGAIDEARKTLRRHGAKKLGPPDARIEAEIAALDDLDRLNELIDRVLDVSIWDELLSPPDPSE